MAFIPPKIIRDGIVKYDKMTEKEKEEFNSLCKSYNEAGKKDDTLFLSSSSLGIGFVLGSLFF